MASQRPTASGRSPKRAGSGSDVQARRAGAIVAAPAEWLDRLLGVLIDNACKYSPEGRDGPDQRQS